MKYWSGLQPLTEENSSGVSQEDINSMMFSSQVIFASYSTLFYLLLLILSILGICYKPCVKIFTSQANLMLFLIGGLLVFVNIFAVEDQLEVKTYFRVATGFIIGIAFTISGAFLFFTKADNNNNHCTLERQQPSMGLVVATITIPLIIAEVFLIASTFGSEKLKDLFPRRYDWVLTISDKLTFLVQKIVQAIVYIILRYKVTSQHYRESARFYFQILSFFNFVEWVDSQVNENNDVKQSGCKEMYGPWFDVFSMFYKALIIDYRLLCSLLFLEHSLEDEHEDRDSGRGQTDAVISRDLTLSERKLQSVGFIAGFTSLSAPICCGLYYVKRLAIPPWVHVFAIFVNLEIIVFGTLFLLKNDLRSGSEGRKGSSGVNFMVCGKKIVFNLSCFLIFLLNPKLCQE